MRERVWSTAGAAASEHLDLWQQAASAAFVDVSVSAHLQAQGLPSIVAARDFGGVEIARIATQPQVVRRRHDHIKADDRHKLFVNLPLTKQTSGRQGDRIARLLPHDFLIVDSTQPFELSFNAPLQQVSVCVSHDMLLPRLPAERDWTAVRVNGNAGIGALAS